MPYIDDMKELHLPGTAALYLASFALIAALGVIGWQALNWMKTDEWQSLTVLTGLASFGVPWATSPTNWLGIHNVLQHVPLSIAVFWTGMLPALLLMSLHNWSVRRRTSQGTPGQFS